MWLQFLGRTNTHTPLLLTSLMCELLESRDLIPAYQVDLWSEYMGKSIEKYKDSFDRGKGETYPENNIKSR